MMRHTNTKFSGGFPLNVGDRQFSTDYIRDLRYQQQLVGKAYENIVGTTNVILSGLVVSQGTGESLDITSGKAIIKFSATIPDPSGGWTEPATTTTEDIYMLVELPALTDEDVSGTYTSGGATNYVKLAYAETDGQTRTRAKKVGSYSHEILPSYVLTCDTTAPTGYEIELARFTESAGDFTIDHDNRVETLINLNNIKDTYFSEEDFYPIFNGKVGNDTALSSTGFTQMIYLDDNLIVFVETGADEIGAYSFDGTEFTLVGSAKSISPIATSLTMTRLNSTDIAISDGFNKKLSLYRFNGSTWSLIGSALSIADCAISTLVGINDTQVGFIIASANELRTYEFNGSTWSEIGTPLTVPAGMVTGSTDSSGDLIDTNTIAHALNTAGGNILVAYEFNGLTWVQKGSTYDLSTVSASGIRSIGTIAKNTIVFLDDANNRFLIFYFNGSSWELLWTTLTITIGSEDYICKINNNFLAYFDQSDSVLEAYNVLWTPKF